MCFFISVYSCAYLVPAGSPRALCALASALLWLPGAPEDFLLGYADKLRLPDWLTAPSVAGTSRNALWIPSDGHGHFFRSLCFPQTRTHKQRDIIAKTQHFRCAQLEEKAPNPAWNLDQKPNPQLRGIWSESQRGPLNGYWPFLIALSLSPPSLPFSPFLSSLLSTFGQLFHTVKMGESSFNFANNASVCASATSEWLAQQKLSLLWWQAHMVSICTSKH